VILDLGVWLATSSTPARPKEAKQSKQKAKQSPASPARSKLALFRFGFTSPRLSSPEKHPPSQPSQPSQGWGNQKEPPDPLDFPFDPYLALTSNGHADG